MGDTSTLAAFERMFDTGGMSAAPSPLTASAEAVTEARALTQRLSRSLGIPTASSLLDQARPRPVLPALARLFARGGLPQGEAVQMSGRSALSLALACCALSTQDGGWCAGIGLGEPAVSAMQDLGVHLPRFVCLDTPAQDWMRVASILIESFDVLLVDPGFSASAGERARIAAKLRDSRATLILLSRTRATATTMPSGAAPRSGATRSAARGAASSTSPAAGSFPGSSEHVTVLGESWEGTDEGSGRLRRRVLRVHSARTGEHTLVLPDPQGAATPTDPAHSDAPARNNGPAGGDVPTRDDTPTRGDVPAGTLRLVRDA